MQKITSKSYKDHKKYARPEDEWVTHENAHEPIISVETYETAKRLRSGRRKATVTGDLGVLNGLMFCEDCNSKLHLKRQIKKNKKGERLEYNYYECRQARHPSGVDLCECHAIKRQPLEELVLQDIQDIVALAKKSEKNFIEKVTADETKERRRALKRAQSELDKARLRITALDRFIKATHEDKVDGKISDERFQKMLNDYEKEQSELMLKVTELEKLINEANLQSDNVHKFLKLVSKYIDPTELTGELVREFVEKIIVGKAEHINGGHRRKRQRVRIIYNYIGLQTDTVMETLPIK